MFFSLQEFILHYSIIRPWNPMGDTDRNQYAREECRQVHQFTVSQHDLTQAYPVEGLAVGSPRGPALKADGLSGIQ
tara:strand:- start:22157 stop:22384 length:228 start_codon:yes stop_codon:yes gene_type:complete